MYDVLSPDGYSISQDETWKTKMKAKDALIKFIHRYKKQGYYSMADRTRIPLADIYDYCKIVKV